MDWLKIVTSYYKAGYYTPEQVEIFVVKEKITASQFQQITGQVYVA